MKAVSKIILGVVLTAGLTASMTSMAEEWREGAPAGVEMAKDFNAYEGPAQWATVNDESMTTFRAKAGEYYHGIDLASRGTVVKLPAGASNFKLGDHLAIGAGASQTAIVTSVVGLGGDVTGKAGVGDFLVIDGAGHLAGTARIEDVATAAKNSPVKPLRCSQGYHLEGPYCIENPRCPSGNHWDGHECVALS